MQEERRKLYVAGILCQSSVQRHTRWARDTICLGNTVGFLCLPMRASEIHCRLWFSKLILTLLTNDSNLLLSRAQVTSRLGGADTILDPHNTVLVS